MSLPTFPAATADVEQMSSHEIESLCNQGPHARAAHTELMRVAATWCAAGNQLTPTALQGLLRWIGLGYVYLGPEVDTQVRLVSRLRAPEFAWEFALRTLMPSRRTEVLAAATMAGAVCAAGAWLEAVKLGPASAGHVLTDLDAPSRQVFLNMGASYPGTATQLAELVAGLMSTSV